jgi:hypothetical protein
MNSMLPVSMATDLESATVTFHDFRLPPQCRLCLHATWIFRSVCWCLFTGVSGQHISPIFLDYLTLEYMIYMLSRNAGKRLITT